MKLYQVTCTDCGAVSPLYKSKYPAGRLHDCTYTCIQCEWRKAGHGLRGLCSTCFTSCATNQEAA